MTEIGAFPERLPVQSSRPQLTLGQDVIDYNQIYSHLSDLNLAIIHLRTLYSKAEWTNTLR